MSDYEVMELKWENGEAEALNGNYIDGLETSSSWSKQQQRWSTSAGGLKAGGGEMSSLESIVEQATNFFPQLLVDQHELADHHQEEVKYNNNYTIISSIRPTTSEYSGGIKCMDHEMEENDDDDDYVVKVRNSISSSSGGKWIKRQNNGEVKVNVNVNSDGKWREEEKLGVVLKSMGGGGGGASSSDGNKCGGKYSSSVLKKRVINRDDEEEEEECGRRRRRSQRKSFINELDLEAGTIISERSRDDHEITTDTTTTIMTWPSFESPPGNTLYHHHSISASDEERISKEESFRSQSSARTSRAAAVHNQSERRRRDRINEKMKALQKLVPNASKTDKASMLDEVIEHLKLLQAQIRMMSNARSMMPQMVMPLGMQQQLQMSSLARMGMGMGMGMVDINNFGRNVPHTLFPLIHGIAPIGGTTPSFLSPPFAMPPMIPPDQTSLKANIDAANSTNTIFPNFNDAYKTLLAQQSINMDFFNKVAALYRQQANQPSNKSDCSMSQPKNGQ